MATSDEFTITEAAKVLGLSRWTVKGYVHSGHLPSRLVQKGRMSVRYIRQEDLEAFRKNQVEKPGQPGTPGVSAQCGHSRARIDGKNLADLAYLVGATERLSALETETKLLRQEVTELRQQLREYESLPWVPQYRRIAKFVRMV